MTLDQQLQLLSVIAQFATSVAAATIAIVAYVASKRAYNAQSTLAMLTAINDFNSLALTSDACLKTFHKLLTATDVENIDVARETWAAYSFLNNRQIHFFLSKTSQTQQSYLEQDKKVLVALLANPAVREALSNGGYNPEFIEYCYEAIRPNMHP